MGRACIILLKTHCGSSRPVWWQKGGVGDARQQAGRDGLQRFKLEAETERTEISRDWDISKAIQDPGTRGIADQV